MFLNYTNVIFSSIMPPKRRTYCKETQGCSTCLNWTWCCSHNQHNCQPGLLSAIAFQQSDASHWLRPTGSCHYYCRQSQPQEQPLNCPASMSPHVQTSPNSSQPTEQHHSNYAPSQPEVTQPANPSGIGALLDQVFLGEPAGSNQPSIDIKEGIPSGASVSSYVIKS